MHRSVTFQPDKNALMCGMNKLQDDELYDQPPPPMPPLTAAEEKKRARWFHALLVFVIFQTLLIITLFGAVVYKLTITAADIAP